MAEVFLVRRAGAIRSSRHGRIDRGRGVIRSWFALAWKRRDAYSGVSAKHLSAGRSGDRSAKGFVNFLLGDSLLDPSVGEHLEIPTGVRRGRDQAEEVPPRMRSCASSSTRVSVRRVGCLVGTVGAAAG
jgi:hypothetical protein